MSKLFLLICNKDALVAPLANLSEALTAPLYPKITNDGLGPLPPLSLRDHRLLCSVCLYEPVFKSFSLTELIFFAFQQKQDHIFVFLIYKQGD